jgi:hypothetical protein
MYGIGNNLLLLRVLTPELYLGTHYRVAWQALVGAYNGSLPE